MADKNKAQHPRKSRQGKLIKHMKSQETHLKEKIRLVQSAAQEFSWQTIKIGGLVADAISWKKSNCKALRSSS